MKRKKGSCTYIYYPFIKNVNGWVVDYKGEKILIPYIKEECPFEFIHIRSGIGFIGLYSRDMKSLVYLENKMEKYGFSNLFLKTLQAQDDLSINVIKVNNKEYKSIAVNYKEVLKKNKKR